MPKMLMVNIIKTFCASIFRQSETIYYIVPNAKNKKNKASFTHGPFSMNLT